VFRKHWLTLRGEFGQDFVRFCEQALRLDHGLPRSYQLQSADLSPLDLPNTLPKEFHAEWPGEPTLAQRGKEAAGLSAAFGDNPPVWLLVVEPGPSSAPKWDPAAPWAGQYPCGVVIVWTPKEPAGARELLVWIRGAYRNLAIGRECMNVLCDHIFDKLKAEAKEVRVRLPGGGRLLGMDRTQKELWLAFFFQYGFRKAEGPEDEVDLILSRKV
jgi:hypothetical protein